MDSQDISRFDPLIERFTHIQEKYRDNYPIILYEPSINCQENKILKDLLQGNNSIHLFCEFKEAFKFAQSLSISFILIIPNEYEEQHLLKNFRGLEKISGRRMFDFEEEALLKDLFGDEIKYFKLKVYVFITLLDFHTETISKEDEEEVMVMCDLKDMEKEFRQDFVVLWYDPKIDFERKSKLEENLGVKIEEENIFLDFSELYQRIQNYTGIPYHLILSRKDKAEIIIKEINNFKDLLAIYVYDNNSEKISDKSFEVQKTLEELIPKIKEGFRTKSKLINTFPAFATNFDAMDKSHFYNLHYYLKGLINFQNRKQAKGDFLKLALKIYQDKDKELKRFETEYAEYNGQQILHWYTRESPVYKLLNNCLRIASSDSILYSRFVLKDMEKAIREQYQTHCKDFNGLVYRGAYISPEEWEKLERNIGQEIEMYGFLSTTVNQRTARRFFESDPQNKIFITIMIPPLPELDEQGFADISQFSDFKGEGEILFNVRSRFRILEANKGIKGRHLVLLYGAQSLRKYMTQHQPVISVELKLPTQKKCNQCGSSKKLFAFQQEITEVRCIDCLHKNSIPQDIPIFTLDSKSSLEGVQIFKGKMLKFHQTFNFSNSGYQCFDCQITGKEKYYKSIDLKTDEHSVQCPDCFKKKKQSPYQMFLAESCPYTLWQEYQAKWEEAETNYQAEVSLTVKLEDQGGVFEAVKKLDLCLEYQKRVVNQLKRRRWREQEKIERFFNIGIASNQSGKHQQALLYLQRATDMNKLFFGENHIQTARCIGSLAGVYKSLGLFQKALDCEKQSLDIINPLNDKRTFLRWD